MCERLELDDYDGGAESGADPIQTVTLIINHNDNINLDLHHSGW